MKMRIEPKISLQNVVAESQEKIEGAYKDAVKQFIDASSE